MISVLHDLSLFDVPIFDITCKSVIVSSDDESCRTAIEKFLFELREQHILVFKAVGLMDNIFPIAKELNNDEIVILNGDTKKFFIKKFPEFFCKIYSNDEIQSVLQSWVSTVYEHRVIYIVKAANFNQLINLLNEERYNKNFFSSSITDCIEGYIQNVCEAEYHDSYLINCKEYIWDNSIQLRKIL